MHFRFIIDVDADHETGKFESRDEISAVLGDEIEAANPEEVTGGNDGLYTITDWVVSEDVS